MCPGIFAIDLLVDLDQLQRAGADLEQVVVGADLPGWSARRCRCAAAATRSSPPQCWRRVAVHRVCFATSARSSANSPSSRFCSSRWRWILPLVVFGMRLTGTTCATSRPVCSLTRRVICAASAGNCARSPRCSTNTRQLVGLGARRAHAGDHHLAQLHAVGALRDGFEIVRVVVLAVDEQDLLGAAGDVGLAVEDQAEIAGAAASHPR